MFSETAVFQGFVDKSCKYFILLIINSFVHLWQKKQRTIEIK